MDREVLLICNLSPEEEEKIMSPKGRDENSEMLDVTGSPLEHSYGDDSFNVSRTSLRRNWMKNEERFMSIHQVAAETLNYTQEKLSNAKLWTTPLFVLADPQESNERCILIGSHSDSRGFRTLRICLGGTMFLSEIHEAIQMEVPFIQHDKNEMNLQNRKKAQVKIYSVYEISGVDPEMVDWKDEEKSEYGGYLSIETSWEELSFIPPLRNSSSTLFASVVSGSKASPLTSLWNELLLLKNYLAMLEEYQTKHMSSRYSVAPLNFPKCFSNVFRESTSKITKKLHQILVGDDAFDDSEVIDDTSVAEGPSEDDYQIKLSDMAKVLEKRPDQDFASILWRIIKGADSYTTMTDCIHTVFEAISMSNFKPSLNVGDDTRFGKLVGGLDSVEKQLPQLAGSISMELVVDMGLEKLVRDYTYLLSTGNLMESYDARKILNNVAEGVFDVTKYREKLMTLAQIHMSLEFLQLIQDQLNCRMDVSRSIFEAALKIYKAPDSPLNFQNLENHVIYSLNVSAPKNIVSEVMKMPPASWMCTLTTDVTLQSYSSVTHYSRTPIFPPNIYNSEDMLKVETDTEGPMYYVTTGSSIHFKLATDD
ncbi:uncharacterized protein Zwilch isoform X2 [Fopius arisanus]|uniref:Protein zwilch n=1 Tax=Fopius arisanus TaxID=64838 RepID=A0A9R1U5I4_9HYME|nr:PREDICTED: uncharacterized protein LOC105269387 isoform X2 [Fopius arisanus]